MIEFLLSTAISTLMVIGYVLPSVFVGLFIANLLSIRSFFASKGARFIPALSRATGLPQACVTSVLLSMGDRTAGLAALSIVREKESLCDADIVASCLVAKAPSAAQPFVLSFLPIMAPMFPAAIVGKFLSLYFGVFLFVTAVGILYARAATAERAASGAFIPQTVVVHRSFRTSLMEALRRTVPSFMNIAAWLVGMSFLAGLLARSGILDGLSGILPITANQVPYAAAGMVSIFGGIGATGVAFRDGFLSQSQLLPLLFATALIHNTYDFFASLLPMHISMFGRSLGLKTAGALSAATIAGILAIMATLGLIGY